MPFKTKEEKQKYMKKYREEKLEENPDLYKKEYNKRKNTEVYKENKRKREKKYYQNNKEKSRAKELASKIPLKNLQTFVMLILILQYHLFPNHLLHL